MRKLAVTLLAAVLAASAAFAGSISGTFTYPTSFDDGTALAQSQIANVRVEYGTCSSGLFGTKLGQVLVAPPATAFNVPSVAPGTYCLRAFTTTTAAAGGQDSVPTSVVSKVVPFPAPNPPVFVTVTTAYEFTGATPTRLVGSVPLGTQCLGQKIGSFYEVPRSKVKSSLPPGQYKKVNVIVAQCAGA